MIILVTFARIDQTNHFDFIIRVFTSMDLFFDNTIISTQRHLNNIRVWVWERASGPFPRKRNPLPFHITFLICVYKREGQGWVNLQQIKKQSETWAERRFFAALRMTLWIPYVWVFPREDSSLRLGSPKSMIWGWRSE